MLGAPILLRCAAVLLALLLPFVHASGQEGSQESSPVQKPTNPESAALRICLRLQDDSPFTGSANVSVMPSEGYEVSGATTESEGEMIFSDMQPGAYVMEASAPGFLTIRQNIQIELGHRLQTRFVIMKPKPLPVRTPEAAPGSPDSGEPPERASWIPPDLDEIVPDVDPSVDCPAPQVVRGIGQRMQQFVNNLEKFTARERVEHMVVDAAGVRRSPDVRNFDYVVMVSRTTVGGFLLDEYRDGSVDPAQFPAHIATQGLPGMALIFHPFLAPDFKFVCEGLGRWKGHPAWQVHFVQRPERPGRILDYSVADKHYPVSLKGRAWVDPGTFQVLRLESDLVQLIREITLSEQHVAIEYGPVRFRTQDQQLWLPQTADLYVERQGRRYHRRHTSSNFKIFTVDTAQSIQLAKESYGFTNTSDREIAGVLTVNPVSGAKLNPVSISFTILAGASVLKLVGPGKVVSIPVDSVGSATFGHNGHADAVKVDAHLIKESTLDVISDTTVPLKPKAGVSPYY